MVKIPKFDTISEHPLPHFGDVPNEAVYLSGFKFVSENYDPQAIQSFVSSLAKGKTVMFDYLVISGNIARISGYIYASGDYGAFILYDYSDVMVCMLDYSGWSEKNL